MSHILTSLQAAQVKRFDIAETFLSEQETVILTYDPFKEEKDDFDINYAALKAKLPAKDAESKTIVVEDQDFLKDLIAEDINTVANQIMSYAIKYKNTALKKAFKISKSLVLSLAQPEVEPYITKVTGYLKLLYTDPNFMKYKVTAADIKIITDNAALYSKNIGISGTTTTDVSIANEDINNLITLLTCNINQMGLLNSYFKTRNLEFYTSFIKNTRRQYPAVHSTGICGVVYNKIGVTVPNCPVKIDGTDNSTVSDATGYYEMHGLNVGSFEATAEIAGGEKETIKVDIRYRHTLTYDFNLK